MTQDMLRHFAKQIDGAKEVRKVTIDAERKIAQNARGAAR